MSIRDEVAEAVRTLELAPCEVLEVPVSEAQDLIQSFLSRFTSGKVGRWWWEGFSTPTTTWHPEDARGFDHLARIVPDPDERLWFVVEGGPHESFLVYEATARVAQLVIGSSYAFEYYLVPKDLSWLVCENHHNLIITVGDVVGERLRALAS